MKFIDEVNIIVGSGRGGGGCISFRRESMTPRGGPDGGDGGRGGDLIIRAARDTNSLVDYRRGKKYIARSGQAGGGSNCTGADGEPLVLLVPPGTVISTMEGDVLVDMTDKEEVVLFKGGRGGKGNWHFKTSVNQAPEHAQPGEDGIEMEVKLELKLIADVGIIGFPNAGKSTLISRISAAKPKIADYPFTTLTPNLGVVKAGDFKSYVVADIPGLIKGASAGVGLGIQFLRHIERTRFFIHMVDCSGMGSGNPLQDYRDLQNELVCYDEANAGKDGFFPLSQRPQMVVLNKIETVSESDLARIRRDFKEKEGVDTWPISAVTGKGLDTLLFAISDKIFGEVKE